MFVASHLWYLENRKQSVYHTFTKLENVETRTYKLIKTALSDEAMNHTQGSEWLCCFKDGQKQGQCLDLFFIRKALCNTNMIHKAKQKNWQFYLEVLRCLHNAVNGQENSNLLCVKLITTDQHTWLNLCSNCSQIPLSRGVSNPMLPTHGFFLFSWTKNAWKDTQFEDVEMIQLMWWSNFYQRFTGQITRRASSSGRDSGIRLSKQNGPASVCH